VIRFCFGILALMAPESLVMNFNCGKRAAGLAAPAIALFIACHRSRATVMAVTAF